MFRVAAVGRRLRVASCRTPSSIPGRRSNFRRDHSSEMRAEAHDSSSSARGIFLVQPSRELKGMAPRTGNLLHPDVLLCGVTSMSAHHVLSAIYSQAYDAGHR